jgi:putative nucleotidyltransferase with HDIG domain
MFPTLLLVQGAVSPAGLLAAFAATGTQVGPFAFGLLLPVVVLLALHARERAVRFEQAVELSRAYRGTTLLLADVLDRSDEYTGSHSRTVLRLAMRVADEMRLPPADRQVVESAALLHDIGKIAIPDEILNKPGRLTDEEFELMKTHTVEGERLLEHVGGPLSRIGRIVRSCHERWDGAGYPDGISGERIPLPARIVFACDAFNAMTTNRVYREAMSVDDAVAELRACASTQFDPCVVEVLIRVVSHGVEDGWLEPECDAPALPSAA